MTCGGVAKWSECEPKGSTCNVLYFKARLGLANGVVQGGAGLGKVIWPLAYSFVARSFGLRGVLVLNGSVALCLVLPLIFFYPGTVAHI